MKLVLIPQPVLTQKSKPVLHFDHKLALIIKDMKVVLEAQTDPPGVGLAAPQVGLPIQVFIIKSSKKDPIETFVNPAVIDQKPRTQKIPTKKRAKEKGIQLEGCLSIPKIWGEVTRVPKVLVAYQTPSGQKKTEWFSGFKAVIIQHEIDHLNGILFTQRAVEQKGTLYQEKDEELEKIKDLI
jgi:peptide deformylase